MSEQPANVAREAKSMHQSLKELLKTKEPFDREVEFQRKNLRKRYLNLLLLHPYAKESKDVENHLWMQTSYAFIASYKQRITTIDRSIQANARQQQGQVQQGQRQNGHGPVEHRKLIQKFRNFLAEEEKFWTQLVLRLRRSFALYEAQPALVALGLVSETERDVSPASGNSETRENLDPHSNGRNQFPEDPSESLVPTTPAERESRLAILSKALICLGDIARYRELYNETGGRPRAGHEDGTPARRGKNRRGPPALDNFPRARNYDKAQQCYEQARSLVPHEGNPSHQLAIIASYRKDSFSSLVHYYRALCVRQPYETAAENLGTVLTKALEQWTRNRKERERSLASGAILPPRDRVDLFKERLVILHALWRKGSERMDSKFREHDKIVYQDFHHLVAERHLPTDMISNTVILSQGALWKHRMIRDSPNHSYGRKPEGSSASEDSISIEWRIFNHLIDIHYALLEVGKDELKDLPSMDTVDNDLAQRISAVFRRTLPALRIASKWLRANFSYVMHDPEFSAFQQNEKLNGVEVAKRSAEKISGYSVHTARFWRGYAQFILALSQAFPGKLPTLVAPLEEDLEMKGFLPLKKLMGEARSSAVDDRTSNPGQPRERVHPNEEQLMRISDLLEDANFIVKMENSPLALYNNHIMFRDEIVEQLRPPSHTELRTSIEDPLFEQQIMTSIRDTSLEINRHQDRDDDVLTEITSRTDDDVLHDAFEHLNRKEVDYDEDQDDEIVWNPRASISPALSPMMQAMPISPVRSLTSPSRSHGTPGKSTLSPIGMTPIGSPRSLITVSAITAQDLLNDVMNGGRKVNSALSPPTDSSGLQPTLLFGSELSHRPTHSIWSAARDEQPLKYTSGSAAPNHHIYQTSPRTYPANLTASQDVGSSIWSSSYPSSIQNSQQHYVGALPSAPFAPLPQHNMIGGGHHRVPSASLVPQRMPQHQSQLDPFLYSSSALQQQQQQPIQRPDLRTHLSSPYVHGNIAPPDSNAYYEDSQQRAYRSRNTSFQQPQLAQSYMSSPISQIWGNIG